MYKNNPFATLRFSDRVTVQKTTTQEHSGDHATWENLNFEITGSKEQLIRDKLHVEVWDENSWKAVGMKDAIIGSANISLDSLLLCIGTKKELPAIDLVDNKGIKTGSLVLTAILNERKPEPGPIALEALKAVDFDNGELTIRQVICKDLAHVEIFGKNDPFVKFTMGTNLLSQKTPTMVNAGSEATWNDLGFVIPVTKTSLIDEKLVCDVYDENKLFSNALIGQANIDLRLLLLNIGKEITLPSADIFKDKLKSGTIKIVGSLGYKTPARKITPVNSKDFEQIKMPGGAIISIRKIVCKGMTNAGHVFGRNHPMVQCSFGKRSTESLQKTSPKENAGSEATWDNLIVSFIVSKEELLNELFTFEVYDENAILSHALIGKSSVSFSELILTPGKEQVLSFEIFENKSGKLSGTAIVYITMSMKEPTPIASVAVDVTSSLAGPQSIGVPSSIPNQLISSSGDGALPPSQKVYDDTALVERLKKLETGLKNELFQVENIIDSMLSHYNYNIPTKIVHFIKNRS